MDKGNTPHTPPTDSAIEASILIVGYRSAAYIERCIAGALRACQGESVELLFIDCSDDGSESLVRARFPSVRVLPSQGNLGFARATNLLARAARGQRLLLLNPDAFAQGSEISALLRLARTRSDARAWAGITVFPDGSVDGGSIQPMLGALPLALAFIGLGRTRLGATVPSQCRPQNVPVLTGAFMLVDAESWRRLEGFDERFFMYAEEVDLCLRLAQSGAKLICDPTIRMLHGIDSAPPWTPARVLMIARGNATFYRKHFGPCWATACNMLLLLYALSRTFRAYAAGRMEEARSFAVISRHAEGWWSGWTSSNRTTAVS